MQPIHFTSKLEQDKDGTWWYVHVPGEIRQNLKHLEKRGIIAVTATLGNSKWNASLLPWADGSAQLSIKKDIRLKEKLELGQLLSISLVPRGDILSM